MDCSCWVWKTRRKEESKIIKEVGEYALSLQRSLSELLNFC